MRDKMFKERRAAPLWKHYVGYDFLQDLTNLLKDQAQLGFQYPQKSHLKYQSCPSIFWSIYLRGFICICVYLYLHWRKADLNHKSHSLDATAILTAQKTKNCWGIFYQKGNILCIILCRAERGAGIWLCFRNFCQSRAAQARSVAPWQRWMLFSLAANSL